MYHRPFFSIPSWLEPFSTVPRYQLITLCTYQKEETLGKVRRHQGQHVWQPTDWGMAATRALKAMQRNRILDTWIVSVECDDIFYTHIGKFLKG